MKQFLVLLAVLPLCLVFLVQFSMDQVNSNRIGILSDMVYSAKEEAKQEGCFTDEIKAKLRRNISGSLGVSPDDILIEATEEPVYRVMNESERGLIHYRVQVPIGELTAGRRLFGIREDENVYYYTIESYTASERLP